MSSILENRGADTNRAAGAIVFAEKDGQRYVLSVQRANTTKWDRQIMLGGAGKIKEKETPEVAMLRELNEELELKPGEILSMRTIGNVPATREEHAGLHATFFLVKVPFERLSKMVLDISKTPKRFEELRGARLSRVSTLAKTWRRLQPHYRDFFPRAEKELRIPRQNGGRKP